MAEGIFRSKVNERKLSIQTDSAGTANYHTGEKPDSRAILCCSNHGVDISDLRARQFHSSDFDKFDSIFVMDESNLQNVLKLAPSDECKKKVTLFLVAGGSSEKEVPDPWYGDMSDFERVYHMLNKATEYVIQNMPLQK
jgi:protein-tyrosine phosphatase